MGQENVAILADETAFNIANVKIVTAENDHFEQYVSRQVAAQCKTYHWHTHQWTWFLNKNLPPDFFACQMKE